MLVCGRVLVSIATKYQQFARQVSSMAVVVRLSLLQIFARVELATLGQTAVSGLARIQKMMALSLVPS